MTRPESPAGDLVGGGTGKGQINLGETREGEVVIAPIDKHEPLVTRRVS